MNSNNQYRDFLFLPEEELFVKEVCEYVLKYLNELVSDHFPGRQTIANSFFLNKSTEFIHLIDTPPTGIRTVLSGFYCYGAFELFESSTSCVLENKQKYIEFKYPHLTKVLFQDQDKVLEMMKRSLKACIARFYYNFKNADTDFNPIYTWRDKQIRRKELLDRIPELEGVF
jgi:hypothetical protein